jgi:dTDP-4-dehydrorhamnose 3,5-epimerase
MAVEIISTELSGVMEIRSDLFRDDRGYFTELHNASTWGFPGNPPQFVQDNMSCSDKGTIRGLHYQINPHAQGKLVRVMSGSVFDVAVDIRHGSPTFGNWIGRTLSEANGIALWIPVGFAHGFLALENLTRVMYKCDNLWAPESERSILYNDETLQIEWPIEVTLVNQKDLEAPSFGEAEYNFQYEPLS